jgi:hypothetical protein
MNPEILYSQAQTAIDLLERLSADSQWAHRGSGYRGALLRVMESAQGLEATSDDPQSEQALLLQLQILINASFALLEKAAVELIA